MPEVTIYMAFAAGLISFLSPCVLPLVPGYLAFISGVSFDEIRKKTGNSTFLSKDRRVVLLNSIFFVAGLSIVFILMGASATWLGAILLSKISLLSKIAGLLIIFFGIYKMGFVRLNVFYKEARFQVKDKKFGYIGATLIGASFAIPWGWGYLFY
jgi:cytochrome c-type biogenesis protein